MKLLHFLTNETETPKEKLLIAAAVSGLGSGMIVTLANIAADYVGNYALGSVLLMAYIAVLLLYIWGTRYALEQAHHAVEGALQRVKVRVADKARQTDLRFIEANGGMTAFSPLVQDTNMVSQGVVLLVFSTQSLFMFIITGLYLAWSSPSALLLALLFLGIAMPIFARNYHKTEAEMRLSGAKEGEFFSLFSDILNGFKELKLNQDESNALFADLKQLSEDIRIPKQRSNERMIHDMLFSSGTFYVLLIVVVFIMPNFVTEYSATIHKTTATILFIMGPLSMFATTLPNLAKVDSSISNLYQLEAALDAASQSHLETTDIAPLTTFQHVQMRNLLFHYRDQDGNKLFTSGPHNLDIHQGELLFIVGGNGSGKSTFLKLLTGLYRPDSGEIKVDGELLNDDVYPAYRELFAIVFTDFHLFDRLYGMADVKAEEVNAWLQEMQLDKKTRFKEGRFTNTDLSTGQKKRLAFIIAVLKKRPICIFDELAADQDPGFRQRFYEEILPNLQKQGFTVLVVSHDDKYFHCADRILKLRDGKILSDSDNATDNTSIGHEHI